MWEAALHERGWYLYSVCLLFDVFSHGTHAENASSSLLFPASSFKPIFLLSFINRLSPFLLLSHSEGIFLSVHFDYFLPVLLILPHCRSVQGQLVN